MAARVCSEPTCEGSPMRLRDGLWWCLRHPTPPAPPASATPAPAPVTAPPAPAKRPPAPRRTAPKVTRPAPPPRPVAPQLDETAIAGRYTAGEALFPLAADLGIGVRRLRLILAAQGVELRKRGEVIGQRGRGAGAIDVDAAVAAYAAGATTAEIGRAQRVRAIRIAQVLRERGVLRHGGHRNPSAVKR